MSRKEGGKIFGSGSRTPISITLLVKNPDSKNEKATIHYHDIGDYLSQSEKLNIVSQFKSGGVDHFPWKQLIPNKEGDWIAQRNKAFDNYIAFEPDKKFDLKTQSFFNTYAVAVNTGRDAWCYNFSKELLSSNIKSMISFYNDEVTRYSDLSRNSSKNLLVEDIIDSDSTKISWTRSLRNEVGKSIKHSFTQDSIRISSYRPFCKQNLYFNKSFNEAIGLSPKLFPKKNTKNIVICVSPSPNDGLSLLISDEISNLHFNGDTQCFPLYYYEENNTVQKGLFDEGSSSEYIRRDGVSDFILERAKKQYGKNVTKEDVFYYVYGFLHSPEYRELFANDLKKMLPRLPLLEDVRDFWAFSKAGRKLAELHLNYETVPAYEGVTIKQPDVIYQMTTDEMYRVTKMRFPKKDQKDTIIYNGNITINNIPAKAYDYVVNGKSAIEWIMERYQITIHKDSGIKNDPNDWSTEVEKPSYIFDLLLSVINVSVQTVEIVEGLPKGQVATCP